MQKIKPLVDDIQAGKTSNDILEQLKERENEAPYASLVYILRAMNERDPELRFQAAIYSPDRGRLKKLVDPLPEAVKPVLEPEPLPVQVIIPKKKPILDFSQGLEEEDASPQPVPSTLTRVVAMWKITPLSISIDSPSPESNGHNWKLSIPSQPSDADISTPLSDYVKEQTNLGQQKATEITSSLGKNSPREDMDLVNKFLAQPPRTLRKSAPGASVTQVVDSKAHASLDSDENLVTETLAKLHLRQNHPGDAIQIYEQLRLRYPEKSRYFEDQIQKIKENEL